MTTRSRICCAVSCTGSLIALLAPLSACESAARNREIVAGAFDHPSTGFDGLRLDQVQLIATHNSYKLEGDDGIDHVMIETGYREDRRFDAEALVYRLAYHHPPLDVQLDLGIRGLELDVHADPKGGLYAEPGGHKAMAKFGMAPNTPFDPAGLMREPGFKVLHVPDWDFMSTCATLAVCLETIMEWSRRHPAHFPIIVRIDAKESTMPVIADAYEPARVPRFDPAMLEALDRAVLETVPRDRIFGPADFQGRWPTVAQARGKLIFLLGGNRTRAADYIAAAGPDRAMFTWHEPPGGARFASIPVSADPRTAEPAEGTLVFASAETYDTREARTNDPSRRDAVFGSHANIVTTDYAIPDPRFSPYRVRFPDGTYLRPHPTRAGRTPETDRPAAP